MTNLKFTAAIVLLSFCYVAFSQTEEKSDNKKDKDKTEIELAYQLNAGYSFGGQFVHESLLFESGVSFELITNLKVSSRLYYGLGVGYEQYDSEKFIPLFLSFKGMTKKKMRDPTCPFRWGTPLGRTMISIPMITIILGVGFYSAQDSATCSR